MFKWNDKEILRYLGCKGTDIPDNVAQVIEECKEELEREASPRSIWREFPLSVEDHVLDMTCFKTKSRNLERNLKDCGQVLLFGATLGSRVDMLLHRYGKIRVSKAVVLQAVSVAMLETYCDEVNGQLKEEYLAKGLYLRPRFSPGYGDFPLESQPGIARGLELSKRIGITLTDGMLMMPSKSVTAVIGISHLPRDCSVQGCEVCAKVDCLYRR